MTCQAMVREFHKTFKLPARRKPNLGTRAQRQLRLALIEEEFTELDEAVLNQDVVEVADALADLAYVVYGAALTFGIDLDAVIAEVHRSNMTKLGPAGLPIVREDGKILKPPTYEPPNIKGVLGLEA